MGTGSARLMGWMLAAAAMTAAAPAGANPREERQQAAACERGERSACIALGRRLAEPYSPDEDPPRALALLRPVCDRPASVAETAEICAIVGDLLLVQRTVDETGTDPAVVEAYLSRACDAGALAACRQLAAELASGALLTADIARARLLHERLCRSGDSEACAMIPRRVADDPGAADVTDPADEDDQPRMLGIVNGRPVPPGSADWVALIWRPERSASGPLARQHRVLCGGSLIAPGWVLTAAHCLDDEIGRVSKDSGHTVRLGVTNVMDETQGQTYRISDVIAHHGFRGKERDRTLAWDIALIRLADKPETRGKAARPIRPVALDAVPPQQRAIPGPMTATVFGWGRTRPGGRESSRVLRSGTLTLEDMPTCTAATAFTDHRRDSVLCARPRVGQHNCEGDSGGPLVLEDEATKRRVLVGVISGARNCGDSDRPSRFVRVTQRSVWAWLRSHLPVTAWSRMSLAVN